MFRLYLRVCHIYKNAKIVLKLNGSVNIVSKLIKNSRLVYSKDTISCEQRQLTCDFVKHRRNRMHQTKIKILTQSLVG
jgi:hypothetical protein